MAKKRMNTMWLRGIDPNDEAAKQKRADLVYNSGATLEALASIIQIEMAALDRPSLTDYDNPNWAYREADRIGQHRALAKILSLTKLEDVTNA